MRFRIAHSTPRKNCETVVDKDLRQRAKQLEVEIVTLRDKAKELSDGIGYWEGRYRAYCEVLGLFEYYEMPTPDVAVAMEEDTKEGR